MNRNELPSPCYVLEEEKLRKNLSLIKSVSERSGVEIILAFKGFAMWSAFPVVKEYVSGATASSLHELMLCKDYMKIKAHTYCVAYREDEIESILDGSCHITFNSLAQYQKFKNHAIDKKVSIGLRVNPEESDVEVALYNPASPHSRLGVTQGELDSTDVLDVEGLHFHVLCESGVSSLEKVLAAVENKFADLLKQVKWINMGGGHLMTRQGYDVDRLVEVLKTFSEKHDVKIILEPGSAFVWQTGCLQTQVLDVVNRNGVDTAIIDASFTCHMPDCLEMPYRPQIDEGYQDESKGKYPYRLGGLSCLAGDFLEKYSFDQPLVIGDTITFHDMIHYTMVKTSTFNGIQHPAIAIQKTGGDIDVIRTFDYEDYRARLS
ncbi:MAG: carboxynorspermidine decarboxylase [Reichenbachiella sp.]